MIHCDVKTCVGCRMCEVACSSHHSGGVSPAFSRIRVAKLEETGLDLAVACVSCLEKSCLECSLDALSVGAHGEICVDLELCNACGTCAAACPIGAAGFHEGRPLFCDLCDGETVCVTVCPAGALSFSEDYREVSLNTFLSSKGAASERRARYALQQGTPLRESWRKGVRIDS